MRNVTAIARREFQGYFNSLIAYVFLVIYLLLTSWLFFRVFFLNGQASMRLMFDIMPWVYLFFVPAITMRLWAEEKKVGTMELLMTLPVRDVEAVLGKFLAALGLLVLALALTFPIPLIVSLLGNLDFGPVAGGYLAAILLGAAYLAVGVFVSSLTQNQIVAFILGVVIVFALYMIGSDIVLYSVPTAVASVFEYVSLGTHFESIGRGVIDSRDLIYYLSIIGFFLYLNVRSIESRKWR
ncbi:MAG: ABC transporter permease subunit [Candidatus Eisenbacteria bacterium]|jgi:ABC-2 type transport system permease protein|nr:ABC transporter permease subunit [Candidatus Eisenbacteria bacterium]